MMDGIFSHADADGPAESPDHVDLEPVVASVTIPMECNQAYEGFVDYLHLWWPLGVLSAIGPGSHLGFEGQALVEESENGKREQWGRIRRAEAPVPVDPHTQGHGRLELEFTLGQEHEAPSRVVVDFHETTTGATQVAVTHDRWPRGAEGRRARDRAEAWPEILGYYQRFMGGAA